jgi:hypothetical protein
MAVEWMTGTADSLRAIRVGGGTWPATHLRPRSRKRAGSVPDIDVATVMTYGADIGTTLAGVGILGGVAAWVRKQQRDRRDIRDAQKHRTRHGYIPVEGLDM